MSVQDGVMNLTFDYQVKLWLGSDGLRCMTLNSVPLSKVSRKKACHQQKQIDHILDDVREDS